MGTSRKISVQSEAWEQLKETPYEQSFVSAMVPKLEYDALLKASEKKKKSLATRHTMWVVNDGIVSAKLVDFKAQKEHWQQVWCQALAEIRDCKNFEGIEKCGPQP